MKITDLEPGSVFYYFNEISKIPRGSGNEKGISDYLYNTAKEKGYEVIQDDVLNIIIRTPGTKGYENAPRVILQGHMDMVCEKDHLTDHDFTKDPIELRIVDDFIYANETTLGGDNGIAVAIAMAALESDVHPPLEAIFTVDEEVNMTGGEHLEAKNITGDILINLDSDMEGVFTTGCAGGGRITYKLPLTKQPNSHEDTLKIAIRGLSGGHSGLDIHLEKGNAIKILGRILNELRDDVSIAFVDGGKLDNAIPREAEAIITTDKCMHVFSHLMKMNKILKQELKVSEPGFDLQVTTTENAMECYSSKLKDQIIDGILLTPSGVLTKSTEIDLVISSNNLGVIKEEKDNLVFTLAPRSSEQSLLYSFSDQCMRLGKVLDFRVDTGGYYPGWTYDSGSPILELATDLYKKTYGKDPIIEAVHAGLECGFFLDKKPSLDAISFGPNLYEIHTPHEHMSISSVKRNFDFLLELLSLIK